MAATSASTPAWVLSTGHDAALTVLDVTKHQVSKANVTAALTVASEKTKELAFVRFPMLTAHAFQACQSDPGLAVACGAAGFGLLLVSTPAALAAPGLAAAGFGTNGIVLGSSAASVHSGIGNVLAQSLFSTLQSAGAGGYGTATVYGAVQVAGGAIASSALGVVAWTKKNSTQVHE